MTMIQPYLFLLVSIGLDSPTIEPEVHPRTESTFEELLSGSLHSNLVVRAKRTHTVKSTVSRLSQVPLTLHQLSTLLHREKYHLFHHHRCINKAALSNHHRSSIPPPILLVHISRITPSPSHQRTPSLSKELGRRERFWKHTSSNLERDIPNPSSLERKVRTFLLIVVWSSNRTVGKCRHHRLLST